MPLIENERVKLTASWFNTVAAATIVTGVIAPLAAAVFAVPAAGNLSLRNFAIATMAWLILGTLLHLYARYLLRSLQE
jgi:dipeptide/tripeptide permease